MLRADGDVADDVADDAVFVASATAVWLAVYGLQDGPHCCGPCNANWR
jgi:hypothetical protein